MGSRQAGGHASRSGGGSSPTQRGGRTRYFWRARCSSRSRRRSRSAASARSRSAACSSSYLASSRATFSRFSRPYTARVWWWEGVVRRRRRESRCSRGSAVAQATAGRGQQQQQWHGTLAGRAPFHLQARRGAGEEQAKRGQEGARSACRGASHHAAFQDIPPPSQRMDTACRRSAHSRFLQGRGKGGEASKGHASHSNQTAGDKGPAATCGGPSHRPSSPEAKYSSRRGLPSCHRSEGKRFSSRLQQGRSSSGLAVRQAAAAAGGSGLRCSTPALRVWALAVPHAQGLLGQRPASAASGATRETCLCSPSRAVAA